MSKRGAKPQAAKASLANKARATQTNMAAANATASRRAPSQRRPTTSAADAGATTATSPRPLSKSIRAPLVDETGPASSRPNESALADGSVLAERAASSQSSRDLRRKIQLVGFIVASYREAVVAAQAPRDAEGDALRGNHETAMESFLAGRLPFAAWRPLGGAETLLSYGFAASDLRRAEGPRCEEFAERLPDDHRRFLASLGAFHRAGGYGFVHAGLRPGVALESQDVVDLTGIRNEFLDDDGDFGFIVVHGHTPVERVDFRANRINLDTGAYLSNRLSVLRIDAAGAALLAPEAP